MQKPETPSERINRIIDAGTPLLYVATWEEERLERLLQSASKKLFGDDRPVWQWTAALGFTSGSGQDRGLVDPVKALAFIIHAETNAIYLMKDLPALVDTNPGLVRALRDAYDALSSRPGTLIISHPTINIPAGLSKEISLLEMALPDVT
ncbi:MAG: hypothetical protein WBS20_08305, partial [Lysobacterales bacterium]